jgi:hypothetical protein
LALTDSADYGAYGELVIGRFAGESGGPGQATITVEQDGVGIGRLDLPTIDYRVTEPNGPGCGLATTATAELSLLPIE